MLRWRSNGSKPNTKVSCYLALSLLFLNSQTSASIPGVEPEKAWDFDGYIKYIVLITFRIVTVIRLIT